MSLAALVGPARWQIRCVRGTRGIQSGRTKPNRRFQMNLPASSWKIGLSFLLIFSLASIGPYAQAQESIVQAQPDHWSKEDLGRYLTLQNGFDPELRKRVEPQRSATSSKAMIVGTS